MTRSNEYQQAADIIDTLDLHKQVYIEVSSLRNFRKYLCELIKKREVSYQYTTRLEDKGLKVVRIR